MFAYIGTYTGSGSKGIYLYRFDTSTGELTDTGHVVEETNPTFLALHPNKCWLYSVSEIGDFEGKPSGGVSAFAIDSETGRLALLNRQASQGSGPCHLSVDASGRYVLVANYGSGSVAILPIEAEGRLGEATDSVQHEGSGADPQRQEGPHAHSFYLDPTNQFALSCDLGLDKVMIYRLDHEKGKLLQGDQPWVSIKPGAGPRHFAFHPNGAFAYAINELDNTVTVFSWDAAKGTLKELRHVSTLPEGYTEVSYCADVHVHPNGRFLYGCNRGHDSMAIFAIDQTSGRLTLIGLEPIRGEFPRQFTLDPSGSWIIVANQNSDNVVTFRIDSETGLLSPAGNEVKVSKPMCVLLM